MKRRKPIYYVVKTCRFTGFVLFLLMLVFVGTGFALCGKCGVDRLIDSQSALWIHKFFDWPLVGLFLLHALTAIYLAMRRWRWMS